MSDNEAFFLLSRRTNRDDFGDSSFLRQLTILSFADVA